MRFLLGMMIGLLAGAWLLQDEWRHPGLASAAVPALTPPFTVTPPAETPVTEVRTPEPAILAEPSAIDAGMEFQAAWMAFRSETSAAGFAKKLSLQLQRTFEVQRQGPGRYLVGFHYASEQERQRVLSSIEQTTGYSMPGES